MLMHYFYHAGTTLEQKIEDIVKVCTGTTDKTLLSTAGHTASQNSTWIDSTIPAGWTRHSTTYSIAPTTTVRGVFLRAPWHTSNVESVDLAQVNNPLQYKYAELKFITATQFQIYLAETATSAMPSVTNNKTLGGNIYQPFVNGGPGSVYIYANKHCIFLLSSTSNTYYTTPSVVVERTRLSLWDTNTAGYPPALTQPSTNPYFLGHQMHIRIQLANGTDSSLSQSSSDNLTYGILPSQNKLFICRDYLGNDVHLLAPINVSNTSIGFLGGNISEMCDIYIATTGFGRTTDEITVGSKTYMLVAYNDTNGAGTNTVRLALRKN